MLTKGPNLGTCGPGPVPNRNRQGAPVGLVRPGSIRHNLATVNSEIATPAIR